MRSLCKLLSALALLATALAPIFYFSERLSDSQMKGILLAATLVWFGTAGWLDMTRQPKE